MASDWPLESHLELGPFPSAVPCARAHARQLLWEWGLANFSERAELLVTELATNAVRASQLLTPVYPIRLWLCSDKQRVAVLIWDASPQPPLRVDVDDDAENGRGLLLVEAISDHWGWYAPSNEGGKVVWCEVWADGPPEAPGENRQERGARTC